MIRTRLLWSSLGFASTSGAIAQFIFNDLWVERNSLASQTQTKDGYVLGLQRVSSPSDIVRQRSSPVLLIHGLFMDSALVLMA